MITTLNPENTSLIKSAMRNVPFMDFVEAEGGERTAADVEAFFTEYTRTDADVLLERLRPSTAVRMWRLFVAYTLELNPYSPLCTQLLEQHLNGKWDRIGLIALVEQKNREIMQQLCA